MDSKPVYFLSTFAPPFDIIQQMAKRRQGKEIVEIPKPPIVGDYNEGMGGVDLADQRVATNRIGIPGMKRWWLQLFFWLLDLAIENSRILCLEATNDLNWSSSSDFRYSLVRELFSESSLPAPPASSSQTLHLPSYIDLRVNIHQRDRRKRLLCHRCPAGAKKKTEFRCEQCGISLCIPECFQKHHLGK